MIVIETILIDFHFNYDSFKFNSWNNSNIDNNINIV